MATNDYDAIIVGGGHNGLTLAAYLARAGQDVIIFERRPEWGSGLNTEEATVPGFYHNLHAQYMEFIDYMPFYHDFNLKELGARMVFPKNQAGIAFADGRPPVILHTHKMIDETHKSIRRYSEKDADRFCTIKEKIVQMSPAAGAMAYSPPTPFGRAGAAPSDSPAAKMMNDLLAQMGLSPYELNKAVNHLIDEVFETPELRALLYRICPEWGTPLDISGMGGGLLGALWMVGMNRLAVGGTHTLTHAMVMACIREGVTMHENSLVTGIIVEHNKAVGVRLRDGTVVRAKKLVACNADLHQVMQHLVGEDYFSEEWNHRVRHFRIGPDNTLATTNFALHEAPKYKSARYDKNINKTFYTVIGYENEQDVLHYCRQQVDGQVPDRPGCGTWVNTLFDPTYGPKGKHSMSGWFFFPPADCLTEREWMDVKKNYNKKFLSMWEEYAPNMTPDNVIGDSLYTPFDIERKNWMRRGDFSNGSHAPDQMGGNRPFPEASQYRTELEGLYICGPYTHPGGGVFAACGYNAFKIICKDYDLPPVWRQPNRFY